MSNSYAQNPLYKNLWPSGHIQKFTLQNGQVVGIKRRPDSPGSNIIITLYAEEDVSSPQLMGEASLFGTPENTQFSIHVHEPYRGLGLGKKFFQTLVALARTLGIQACTHVPVPPPSKKVLEKLEQLKWLRLEYESDGQLRIHCQFNQRMKI
ncbi:MAG: hypothetical protein A2X86_11635 [Bdellovibrionales bacterium GWA2_49_15]|nr:MAG: hypothetical protein A2X86_11635 [Bdellovibrionales bacterium GWA2_49_15]HAZ12597.1 hypothetical protein [Bdellovibrionales bacterium]